MVCTPARPHQCSRGARQCGRAAAARGPAVVAHAVAAVRMIGAAAFRVRRDRAIASTQSLRRVRLLAQPRYNAGPGAYLPVIRADIPEDEEAAEEHTGGDDAEADEKDNGAPAEESMAPMDGADEAADPPTPAAAAATEAPSALLSKEDAAAVRPPRWLRSLAAESRCLFAARGAAASQPRPASGAARDEVGPRSELHEAGAGWQARP
jgi:hypothetical protein